jgi:hypothetical protein
MDTNWIERTLRGPVVGRKNYYGCKTLVNARMAAIWHSVIQTCVINGVEPREYINQVLRVILTKQKVLMPWEWPGRKIPESPPPPPVSETAVSETPPGLTVKATKTGPIAVSQSVS